VVKNKNRGGLIDRHLKRVGVRGRRKYYLSFSRSALALGRKPMFGKEQKEK